MIEFTVPPCDTWDGEYCDLEFDHKHTIRDSEELLVFGVGTVYLPHSCNEWVIGGAKQVKELISDLQSILEKLNQE